MPKYVGNNFCIGTFSEAFCVLNDGQNLLEASSLLLFRFARPKEPTGVNLQAFAKRQTV